MLPTARSARFSSGLGVLDFMKRTSLLKCGPEQLRALGPAAIALGEAEGLDRPRPLGRDPPQSAMSPAETNRPPAASSAWSPSRSTRNRSAAPTRTSSTSAQVAIYDLLEQNSFAPVGHDGGPYALHLSINDNRLVFDIRLEDGTPVVAHLFSLSPLRRIVKDYYMICDSYYQAIRTATPDKIEAIDMGRRGIHNDGSRHPDGAAQGQGDGRFRHRAPPVHVDLRAALEGLNLAWPRPSARARPQAVLFACGMNTVRSPMAAGLFQQMFGKSVYVASAGVHKGELDPFAVAVMEEIGIDIARHKPMTFEELDDLEGLNFDLIVTLSPPAHHKALELTRTDRGRRRILADGRPDRDRGQPRAAARGLSRGARPIDGAHPRALRPAERRAMNDVVKPAPFR